MLCTSRSSISVAAEKLYGVECDMAKIKKDSYGSDEIMSMAWQGKCANGPGAKA